MSEKFCLWCGKELIIKRLGRHGHKKYCNVDHKTKYQLRRNFIKKYPEEKKKCEICENIIKRDDHIKLWHKIKCCSKKCSRILVCKNRKENGKYQDWINKNKDRIRFLHNIREAKYRKLNPQKYRILSKKIRLRAGIDLRSSFVLSKIRNNLFSRIPYKVWLNIKKNINQDFIVFYREIYKIQQKLNKIKKEYQDGEKSQNQNIKRNL